MHKQILGNNFMDEFVEKCSKLYEKLEKLKEYLNKKDLVCFCFVVLNPSHDKEYQINLFSNEEYDQSYYENLIINDHNFSYNYHDIETSLKEIFQDNIGNLMIQLFENKIRNFAAAISFEPKNCLIDHINVYHKNKKYDSIKCFLQKEAGRLKIANTNHDLFLNDGSILFEDLPTDFKNIHFNDKSIIFKKHREIVHLFQKDKNSEENTFEIVRIGSYILDNH